MKDDDLLYPAGFVAGLEPWKPNRLNSSVATVCRLPSGSCLSLRGQLEACFAALPCGGRDAMRPRLRSTDGSTFWSAVHELFLWWLFERLGWEVTHDPAVGELTPDFVLEKGSGERLFVEAWTDMGSRRLADQDRNATEILAQVNKGVQTSAWLQIDWQEIPPPLQSVDTKGLVGEIRAWLQGLTPGPTVVPERTIRDHGVHITVSAYPSTGSPRRERVGVQLGGAYLDDPRPRQHDALSGKARRYGSVTGDAFALALCPEREVLVDDDGLLALCYGTMRLEVSASTDVPCPVRQLPPGPDGLFSKVAEGGGRLRTHVSGLIYCKPRYLPAGAVLDVRILHSPFACKPMPAQWFGSIPQFVLLDGELRWVHRDSPALVPG